MMQPPPRAPPPGATGGPPSGAVPNAFRRNRSHKQPGNGGPAQVVPLMTDPFAFSRQLPPAPSPGSVPPSVPMQTPFSAGVPVPVANLGQPPLVHEGPHGVPHSHMMNHFMSPRAVAPVPPTGQLSELQNVTASSAEQRHFNSQEPVPYITQDTAPYSSTTESRPTQEFPPAHVPPATPCPPHPSQWIPEHGSRPPSVQNYFQPTSDHSSQSFHASPPIPTPQSAPSAYPPPQTPPVHPSPSLTPSITPAQDPQPQVQPNNYFSQNCTAPDPWFHQPPTEQFYHQMGGVPSNGRLEVSSGTYIANPGTISMFFEGNNVENEETITGEPSTMNGVPGPDTFSLFSSPSLPSDGALRGPLNLSGDASAPYMNNTGFGSSGPKNEDLVENLECVPNQEVLPSEPNILGEGAGGGRFEPGPNLETPDTAAQPVRSESVSSSTATGSRRHQGVVGTFIQQEVAKPTEHSSSPAGYFEQIDTSPAGVLQPQPLTPSPPKPTGVFQASANSSFEPVRSHSVGVRPFEVDQHRMIVEKSGAGVAPSVLPDPSLGNLEQPPDNLENLFGPTTAPLVERRPSSRTPSARVMCESPATTLWAQSEPSSASTTILLAPAAPPMKQRNSEVIQPPEDGPLDLQTPPPTSLSENMENPPGPNSHHQASLGYASLLVSSPATESFHNQPILIAPPTTNYSVIPASNSATAVPGYQSSSIEPQPVLHPAKALSTANLFASPISDTNMLNQTPLNLATDTRLPPKAEMPALVSTGGSQNPPLPKTSQAGASQATPFFNSHPPPTPEAPKQPANHQLLDFTMHQIPANQKEAPQQAPPPKLQGPFSNMPGFYLQVTKDSQQGVSGEAAPPSQRAADPVPNPPAQVANSNQPIPPGEGEGQPNQAIRPPPPGSQYPPPPPAASQGAYPSPYPLPPGNSSRPPSVMGALPMYGGYYGGAYPDYMDGRPPYPPQYPLPDPRAQQYYQDDPYRRYGPHYRHYDGSNPGYRDERYQPREQPERPSSRSSQNSDRPLSRQGYHEDYQRASQSAYDAYYADYYKKQYDYGDRSRWEHYDPAAYTNYYDPSYWYNYNPDPYRSRDIYYNHQYSNRYDNPWQFDPRYDRSFDDDYQGRRDPYVDDYDRRSVHSEQSAHSVHSSHSQHSRRSSFSSHSQNSRVYRSKTDLVTPGYEPTTQAPSLPDDYSYRHFPESAEGSQSYSGYQYPGGYPSEGTWPAQEQLPPRPVTPEKYTVPHRCARFGPGGQLIQVLPNLPSAGQPALVEIHTLETMLQDLQEQEELRTFPGPLVKEETHKVDVIKFAQNKSLECTRNDGLLDKDSAKLIWDFIMLLCRQNGTVVGTDIADLLLREHQSVWLPGKSPNEANLIDFNNEPLDRPEEEPGAGPLSLLSDTLMTVPENASKETERFRELLLFGRKKDALESAMKNSLWGHALLLASKMDNRTHARVMTRFANSLPINDPLQTVYQLMSGRMPAAATCCGDEKWGDWRPHLAMVLSNLTHTLDLDTRTIVTMGDTLVSKGLIDAAHFCYMMAQVGLGVYTKKSTKMVLIGSNHSLPFFKFASNEAIQRTEAYEYAQSLGSQPCSLPNFQVFKFIYACRLAEAGLCAQAFHYCEVISRALLTMPPYHSPVFVSQLIEMSAKLRFFDPQLKEKPEQELFIEPEWLVYLRQLDGQIREGAISYNPERTTPQQYVCSTPSSEFDQVTPPDMTGLHKEAIPDNPLMSSLLPSPGTHLADVQLMPPAPPPFVDERISSMPQAPPPIDGVQFYPLPPAALGSVPVPAPLMQDQTHVPGYPPMSQAEQPPGGSVLYPAPSVPPMMPPVEPLPPVVERQLSNQGSSQSSPSRDALTPHMDFYDKMAGMGSGRRSRTTSQSSLGMMPGRRSRTTSESSTHSMGRERRNSAAKQSSPPPQSIPEQPTHQEEHKKQKKESPKRRGGWFGWFSRPGKNEAHLPDDKNKSIVWDEKKQRWVNLDEPEEEYKPPPPPPMSFPKMANPMGPAGPGMPPGGGPPVNMFSRRAGPRNRYVDVLNPGGSSGKPAGSAPVPADLFAPLAPMPIPPNLFVPGAASDGQQPMEGSVADTAGNAGQEQSSPNLPPLMAKQTLYPPENQGEPNTEASQLGEDAPPAGGVTFYNPSQFAQPNAPAAGARSGRLAQRKYPALK